MVSDLLLFPHCDLHMALSGTPPLQLRVFERNDPPQPGPFVLTEVTPNRYVFDFFAPHNDPGHRLDEPLPKVNSGFVTATTPGVYLFQLRVGPKYLVGRLQVHQRIEKWWFGNESITTAKDSTIAHSQPSIYAQFSDTAADQAAGTDLVGDITGHGYVVLTSTDITKVTVSSRDRLRGVVATDTPVMIEGTFSIPTDPEPIKQLPVRVVDYDQERVDLHQVQTQDVLHAEGMHNILFLGEGFRAQDRGKFLEVVTLVTREMFSKPRHQPFAMLQSKFNVFLAYTDSQESAATCGFRVTDQGSGTGDLMFPGTPIPYNLWVNKTKKNIYRMSEFVSVVGLPKRLEGRSNQDLTSLWQKQDLRDFKLSKVDDELIDAWKVHQSSGILDARDTYFGIRIGGRLADRRSGESNPATNPEVKPPARDIAGAPDLRRFIARVYEFYETVPNREGSPDPRRYPPELYVPYSGVDTTESLILRYIGGLKLPTKGDPLPIGKVWLPGGNQFKPSLGLTAMIINDDVHAAENLGPVTTQSVRRARRLDFKYKEGNLRMQRDPPENINPDIAEIVDVITHEFAHSFNLADEYEEFGGDDPQAISATKERIEDNVTPFGMIRFGAASARAIDPDKVKWINLPRIRLSARLLASSTTEETTGIQVTIDPLGLPGWAKLEGTDIEVHLCEFQPAPQLPLLPGTPRYLTDLRVGKITDPARGTLLLVGPGLPPTRPYPTFHAGSALFVPLKDRSNNPEHVVLNVVLEHLRTTNRPLNLEQDTTQVNPDPDAPEPIGGIFVSPCVPRNLIGVYEGGGRFAGGNYRPAGSCKMRDRPALEGGGRFCYVCKWLIVNRVDPTFHAELNRRFFPGDENG